MNKIIELLQNHHIFKDCNKGLLLNLLEKGNGVSRKSFLKGEVICNPESSEHRLFIILKGTAKVTKGEVNMSALKSGDVFGAASLYSNKDFFISTVTAAEKCDVLCLTREFTDTLFKEDVSTAINYIQFLSDRIYFLNGRIDNFTGGTTEQRLASFLIESLKSSNNNIITLNQSITQLTRTLDVARASLYRAFDEFTAAGAIKKDGKSITVINSEKLLQYCK